MDMNIIMNDSHIVSMWQVEESVKTAVVPTLNTWVTGISLSMKHERLMASTETALMNFSAFTGCARRPRRVVLIIGRRKKRRKKKKVKKKRKKKKMNRMSNLENAKIMHENKQKLFAAIKKC